MPKPNSMPLVPCKPSTIIASDRSRVILGRDTPLIQRTEPISIAQLPWSGLAHVSRSIRRTRIARVTITLMVLSLPWAVATMVPSSARRSSAVGISGTERTHTFRSGRCVIPSSLIGILTVRPTIVLLLQLSRTKPPISSLLVILEAIPVSKEDIWSKSNY